MKFFEVHTLQLNGHDIFYCDARPVSLEVCEKLLVGGELKTFKALKNSEKKQEFAVSRAMIRELLGSEEELLKEKNRALILPAGVEGSLSHKNGIVAFAFNRQGWPMGLDIEVTTDISEKLLRRLVSLPEEQLVKSVVTDSSNLPNMAATVFSAKESLFKAFRGEITLQSFKLSQIEKKNMSLEFAVPSTETPLVDVSYCYFEAFSQPMVACLACLTA